MLPKLRYCLGGIDRLRDKDHIWLRPNDGDQPLSKYGMIFYAQNANRSGLNHEIPPPGNGLEGRRPLHFPNSIQARLTEWGTRASQARFSLVKSAGQFLWFSGWF